MIGAFIQAVYAQAEDGIPVTEPWPILTAPDSAGDQAAIVDRRLEPEIALALVKACGVLTPAARLLVRNAPTLRKAIGVIFDDKAFKAALRDYGVRNRCEAVVSRVLRQGRDFVVVASASEKVTKRPASASEPTAVKKLATPPSAKVLVSRVARIEPQVKEPNTAVSAFSHQTSPTPNPLFDILPSLVRFGTVTIHAKVNGLRKAFSFVEALLALQDAGLEKQHAAIIDGVARSAARISLIILERALRSDKLPLREDVSLKIRIAAIRLYSNFNASDTSYRRAKELFTLSDGGALPDGERLKVRFITARAALRSGRTDEAQEMYRQLFLEMPDRPDVVMQYITSIFATKPTEASALAGAILDRKYLVSASDSIFLGELCLRANDRPRATGAFMSAITGDTLAAEGFLGLSNASLSAGDEEGAFAYLQQYGKMTGLELKSLDPAPGLAPFRLRAPDYERRADHPKIAVVMTTYNAESTLEAAVASVLAQTLSNLELWVIDDMSSDGSAALATRLAEADPRIKPIRCDTNRGTYAAKNLALRRTDAAYVTLHDSDDWMHPRKLEYQLDALSSGGSCSVSNWIRMDSNGKVHVRRGGPYSHLNPASTFLSRELMAQVGYFDEVRTGADAEFLMRLRAHCGWANVVDIGKTLAVGLHHEASLTTSGVTAFDEHRYSPVRLSYTESWLEWHLEQVEKSSTPNLSHDANERPFAVPDAIRC